MEEFEYRSRVVEFAAIQIFSTSVRIISAKQKGSLKMKGVYNIHVLKRHFLQGELERHSWHFVLPLCLVFLRGLIITFELISDCAHTLRSMYDLN